MKFKQYKMSSLNEAFFKTPVTACDDDDLEVVVAADPTYADALVQAEKTQKVLDDRFKDFNANMKEFAEDNNNREKEGKAKMELKKLHLSEGLFEDVDPHLFRDDEELVESPVVAEEPKKKRTRGENEKKERRDYSSEDLWLAVYDELCATVDNEGEGQQVYKQVKARKGERYEHVYPHGDSDLIIYAQSPEQFEFAKKVCDYYDVTYEEPKEDTNKNTNGYYKYSMIIRIPEDGLYDED